eukprot:Skav220003  [mRNA]  locus=scaffold947:105005:109000:+ [translate_table: standard]
MILWFTALQLVESIRTSISASSAATPTRRLLRVQSAEMHMEAIKINTVCWATLLGHVTGFAAINAWGTLQQAVPRNLLCTFLVPGLAFAGIFCFYQATEKLRKKWTDLDGEEDEFEKLWAEEVAETEDDVMSLAVSFLLVQALRFLISGSLPDAEASAVSLKATKMWKSRREADLSIPWIRQMRVATRRGNCAADRMQTEHILCSTEMSGASLVNVGPRHFRNEHRLAGTFEDTSTIFNLLAFPNFCPSTLKSQESLQACCPDLRCHKAWCMHFTVDWWLSANIMADRSGKWATNGLQLEICRCYSQFAHLRALIQSLGILIGFSWERSFDEAVGGLAEGHVFGLAPPVLTLLLAIVLASMVPSSA